MTDFTRKSFNQPDETQDFPLVKMDIMSLGDWNVYRFTFEPGWRWTEHAAPYAETDTCQEQHPLWTIISGRFIVQMDDGRKEEFSPSDIGFIPPGHDAWVAGDEPVVALDFQPVNPNGF